MSGPRLPRLTKSYESSLQPAATIRSSVLLVVVDALERLRLGTGGLLARHGLSRSILDDPYDPVSLRHYVAFFEDAARESGNLLLGIRLGEAIRPEDLGPIGVLFTMMPTLRTAIESFGRYFPALQGSTRLGLVGDRDGTWFDYRIDDPLIWPRRHDAEFTLALVCALTRSRLGRAWAPEEVHFEHSAPARAEGIARFFGTIVRFEQPLNRLLIRPEDLDAALASANPAAIAIVEQHLTDLIGDTIPQPLAQAATAAVARCMKQGKVGLERVAIRLGLEPRTLQRRLRAEGLTFRELVEHVRRREATALLRHGHMSLSAVARGLGYADVATMSRAFRNWTGESPRAFSRRR